MRALLTAIMLAGALSGAAPAVAQGTGPGTGQGTGQGTARTQGGWEFSLTPYLWFSGASGDVTLPRDGTRDFSADFGDIFGSLKLGAMGTFEARKDRFSLVFDLMYLRLEQGFNTPHSLAVRDGEVQMTTTEISAIGLFRAVETANYALDVGGGVRAWWLDSELRATAGLLAGRSAGASPSWVDPIVSMRAHLRLTDSLSLSAYGDIGGFDTGSQLTWQAIGTLNWQVTSSIAARIGWRHLYVDYSRDAISVDLALTGPFLGATYRF